MKEHLGVDIDKSVGSGRLTFSRGRDWMEVFSTITVCTLFLSFICCSCLLFFEADFSKSNDSTFSVLLAIASVVALYGIYRMINRNKLVRVETGLAAEQAKAVVMGYLGKRKITDIKENRNCIVAHEFSTLSARYYKQITVLILDNEVFLNVTRHNSETNVPVFFTHIIMGRAIRKFCSAAKQV